MERVRTLVEKLQHQLEAKVPENDLLLTVQLLYSELLISRNQLPDSKIGGPFVLTALSVPEPKIINQNSLYNKIQDSIPDEEKMIEVLKVDEKEIEEELELIRKNAELKNNMSANVRSDKIPEAKEEPVNRLAPPKNMYQAEETSFQNLRSINDRHKEDKTEIAQKLVDTPIKDLKKGIDINDRFVFIKELFNNDEVIYERSIKTINGFSIYPEAEYWIRRELKLKYGWKEGSTAVKKFDQLVRRRFL